MKVPFTKDMTTIFAMDLSMNLPCMVVLRISEDKKIIIQDVGYVDNKKNTKKKSAEKLSEIKAKMCEMIYLNQLDLCPQKNLHIVREKGFSRFAMTTQLLFRVVGVSDVVMYDLLKEKDITEITPTSVKKLVTGDGKASKDEVMDEVRKYLCDEQKDFEFYSDDVSDAVAVGVAYALKKGLLV